MTIAQVRPEDTAAWIAAHTSADGEPLLLDVRNPDECAYVSIAPAGMELAQWPMSTLPERLPEMDPDRPTLVMCHSGGRSQQVAQFLAERGFCHLANLLGGIDAWAQQMDPTLPRY